MSKKLVEIPVEVFHAFDKDELVIEDNSKLPRGVVVMPTHDATFKGELFEQYAHSCHRQWLQLWPWVCALCGAPANDFIYHGDMRETLSNDVPCNQVPSAIVPLEIHIFPECGSKYSLLMIYVINDALNAMAGYTTACTKKDVVYCQYCHKYEPSDGPFFYVCSRCETVAYCSEECQRAHHKMHKKACKAVLNYVEVINDLSRKLRKTRQSEVEKEKNSSYCEQCQKCEPNDGPRFKVCKRCKIVSYCSKDCQATHWKEHKKVCQPHSGTKKAYKQLG